MSNDNGAHVEVLGTGVPPVTPNLGLPRYSGADPADYPTQTNAITDLLDTQVAKRRLAVTAQPIFDVGVLGQIRAGRQLTAADFTSLGLSAPAGLWNLSDLSDASGNGRTLANKGAVPFGSGINGQASTAAVFAGSTGQALYIGDTGASDPFRIRTGSVGCWFRTAKRGLAQNLLTKWPASGVAYNLFVAAGNNVVWDVAVDATGSTGVICNGASDAADDRWHFIVGTFDGTAMRVYVDGVLEGTTALSGVIYPSAGPLNLGAQGADGSTAAANPHYGRVDEAFVTADVLSDDQIRALYCAKISHGFATTPSAVSLAVRRARKGGPLAASDFPTPPLRLHNFTNGSLTDQGSGGVALTNNGAAVSVVGADGAQGGAYNFVTGSAQSLSATDAGLPSGLAARSYGCWFKTTSAVVVAVMAWGSGSGSASGAWLGLTTGGLLYFQSGADTLSASFVADGLWHFVAGIEDNAAGDGVRRKLYLDGRLVGGSTVLNALTLGGANRFRVGSSADASVPFTGQIDGAFICDYALPQDTISRLYAKGSQTLAPSVKNAGDHVEAMDATNIYGAFDTLPSQHQIDLAVTG